MSKPKRLFFAIELPGDVQQQIVHWRAASFPGDAGRPVAAANLHLTLAFLGELLSEPAAVSSAYNPAARRAPRGADSAARI